MSLRSFHTMTHEDTSQGVSPSHAISIGYVPDYKSEVSTEGVSKVSKTIYLQPR
ncbi:hypothetical protein [Pedobacter sp. BS3]|uniref:hypothetical protein n=1 Tax=Pedobacter sp. BS3 TaxID=2567937 RepID=UPI001658FCB1|nr:hypothetical protein [Pedobacter sp. BS3]